MQSLSWSSVIRKTVGFGGFFIFLIFDLVCVFVRRVEGAAPGMSCTSE